ncbi:MAG: hypothetical protein IPK99_14845 [Flavobacteriales bacterium]|nr:hypothetical protein [Flavobacteriales bacterium]
MTCRAFCCESLGTGPEQGEAYRTGHQASKKLTEAAMAIARGDYPDDLAQSAIWVLSNAHDIASMGALDSTAADTLRYAVSRISGQPAPLHTLRYADDQERVCSGRPASIARTIQLSVGVSTILNAVVVDRSGKIVAVLHDHTLLEPGAHSVPLDVQVLDWPTGSYGIHAWTSDRAGVHRMPFTRSQRGGPKRAPQQGRAPRTSRESQNFLGRAGLRGPSCPSHGMLGFAPRLRNPPPPPPKKIEITST